MWEMKQYYILESRMKEMSYKKQKWDRIFRRNCLLKHVTEENIDKRIEVTGRWGIRRKQSLDDLKEKRWYSKLKQKAPVALCAELSVEEAMDLS